MLLAQEHHMRCCGQRARQAAPHELSRDAPGSRASHEMLQSGRRPASCPAPLDLMAVTPVLRRLQSSCARRVSHKHERHDERLECCSTPRVL